MKNVLTEEEKSFNQTVLYGKDTTVANVINTAKRFPMMASHQVVILKEAQELSDFADLIHYVEHPQKSTILVLNYKYKNLDKRKKLYKSLQQNAVIYESKKLYDDKIPGWIADYLKEKNYRIEPKAAMLLNEFLGNELSKIENELKKLLITLPEGMNIITAGHIERNIGISKEYNNFELQKALIKKDVVKANRIINYFANNQKNHHIAQTITHLYFFFSKLLILQALTNKSKQNIAAAIGVHPYFVPEYEMAARTFPSGKIVRIISLLRDYDMKTKGYPYNSISTGDLLKEMIFKILH